MPGHSIFGDILVTSSNMSGILGGYQEPIFDFEFSAEKLQRVYRWSNQSVDGLRSPKARIRKKNPFTLLKSSGTKWPVVMPLQTLRCIVLGVFSVFLLFWADWIIYFYFR